MRPRVLAVVGALALIAYSLVAVILSPPASADESRPLDMIISGPEELVLGMPLDLQMAATPRVVLGLSGDGFAVWIQRSGEWVVHREIDPSLGCGVAGGIVGGAQTIGHRYEFTKRVHIEEKGYAKGRLAFTSAGSYRLRVTYHEGSTRFHAEPVDVASNEITVRVVEPPASEQSVFERAVRDAPELLDPRVAEVVDPTGKQRAALVSAYPNSIYVELWQLKRR